MLNTREEIIDWLKNCEVENYTIGEDLVVDVKGDVLLDIGVVSKFTNFRHMPVVFGRVDGYFSCSVNKLTSLLGCPTYVGGNFDCSYNHLLSLEGCPDYVGGDFRCHRNKLSNLVGGPIEVVGVYDCGGNQLTSLDGFPEKVGDGFYYEGNENLWKDEF